MNDSGIKDKIKKFYGNFYDMKWDQNENKYVKKDKNFLTASSRFFINVINIIEIIIVLLQFIINKRGFILIIPFALCFLSLIFLNLLSDSLKKKAEVISLLLFVGAIISYFGII